MVDEETKERWDYIFQSEEIAKLFFTELQDNIDKEIQRLKDKYKELNEETKNTPLVDSRFIIKILGDAVIAFTGAYDETAGIVEVLCTQNRRLRRQLAELSNIMKTTGEEQRKLLERLNDKLQKQEKDISDLSTHKENLVWLSKFFKKETTSQD